MAIATKPPDLSSTVRHAWLRALHREDLGELKTVYLCSKHFREGEIEYTHKVPNGDGTFREIPRNCLKLKEDAVPSILPGCPTYYSSHSTTKRSRLSLQSKDDELLSQALTLSLTSQTEENHKFFISNFQDLQDKLPSEMKRSGKFMDRTGPSLNFSGRSGPVQTAHLKPWIGLDRSGPILFLSVH